MTQFDPKLVNISFGPLPLLGFADGDKISVTWLGDGDSAVAGTDGEAVVVRSHDRRAEVTVRLMATGAGRTALAALLAHYNAEGPPLPLVISSIDTGEGLASGEATIKNPPETVYAAEAPVREVVFVCHTLRMQTIPG